MHRLLGLASAPSTLLTPSGASSNRGWGADVHAAPIPRLQIGPGRNPGSCIRTRAAACDPLPLTDNGRRNFCLAYHYAGRCNLNCGGKATHQPLSRGGEQRLHAWKVKWVDPPIAQTPAPASPPARLAPWPSPSPAPGSSPRAPANRPSTPGRERSASPAWGRPLDPNLS
jgi:hypothetical protein